MNSPRTVRHAIQYLEDAQRVHGITEWFRLRALDPRRPCAAYGAAKDAFFAAGSLATAISDLRKQLGDV